MYFLDDHHAKLVESWTESVKTDKEIGGDKLAENLSVARKALDTFGTPELRDVLNATASGQLTITKHPHGCLMVFPRPEWEKFRERIAALPMSAQWWKRIFLGNAMDVDMDGTGRVLVSPESVSYTHLTLPTSDLV